MQPIYRDYEYLYKMEAIELTEFRVRKMKSEKEECEQKLLLLRKTDEKELWLSDLDHFEGVWKKTAKRREELRDEHTRRMETLLKKQLEPIANRANPNHRNEPAEIAEEDISLDSRQRAELERSQTENMSEERKVDQRPAESSKADPSKLKSDKGRLPSDPNAERRIFCAMLLEM